MIWIADSVDSWQSMDKRYRVQWRKVGFGHQVYAAFVDGKETSYHRTLAEAQQWCQDHADALSRAQAAAVVDMGRQS